MKLIKNSGNDRVLDVLRSFLQPGAVLSIASGDFSLLAFSELRDLLSKLTECRLIVADPTKADLGLLGSDADRAARNKLQARWLATRCFEWLSSKALVHLTSISLPQSTIVVSQPESSGEFALTGTCPLTTAGLGLTPSNQFGLIQFAESPDEASLLASWFAQLWASTAEGQAKEVLLALLAGISDL